MALIHIIAENDKFPVTGFSKGTLDGTLEIASLHTYPREVFDNNAAGLPIFSGFHRDASATAGASDWTIIKAVYTNNTIITDRQILSGAWSGRSALAWSI